MTTRPAAYTVRVDQHLNAALKHWATEAAAGLGVSRVSTQDLTTALYTQLLTDPALSAAIVDRIADTRTA